MPEQLFIFDTPENFSLNDLKKWFSERRPVEEQPPTEIQRIYYDTFDWRLFNSGSVLEISSQRPGYLLTWRELGGGGVLEQLSIRRIPEFAHDLVAPGLRTRLEKALGGRSLIPKLKLKSRTSELRVINNDRKTLMRFELRQDRVVPPESTKNLMLPAVVYLSPLRGFDDAYEKSVKLITRKGRLKAALQDPFLTALNALQVDPKSFSNNLEFEFNPKQTAYEALCTVLNRHRCIMEQNIAGACEGRDPEFLHDFLHAARRSKCLLRHYHAVFPSHLIHLIRQDFEWVEEITAPVRSLDIYLGLFDEFVTRVDAGHRKALEPLKHFLQAEKQKEHELMRVPLESPRYRRTMERWEKILSANSLPEDLPDDATKPILEIASRGIYSLYQELVEKGSGVSGDDPDALLELQIIEKRLGYQMETFRSLYPKDQITPLIAALRQLQNNLNSFQNLHLQHGSLLDYSRKMQQQMRTMPVWLEAIALLAADREKEEHKRQADFAKRYDQLACRKMQKKFQKLFSPQ